MRFEDQFFAWITAQPAVSAVIANRIYPEYLPQGVTYPAVRFEAEPEGGFKDFDGQGSTIRVQLRTDCIATTKAGALDIADALISVMKNFTGTMNAVQVDRIFLETQFGAYEPALDGGMFRQSQAWTLHYH